MLLASAVKQRGSPTMGQRDLAMVEARLCVHPGLAGADVEQFCHLMWDLDRAYHRALAVGCTHLALMISLLVLLSCQIKLN